MPSQQQPTQALAVAPKEQQMTEKDDRRGKDMPNFSGFVGTDQNQPALDASQVEELEELLEGCAFRSPFDGLTVEQLAPFRDQVLAVRIADGTILGVDQTVEGLVHDLGVQGVDPEEWAPLCGPSGGSPTEE